MSRYVVFNNTREVFISDNFRIPPGNYLTFEVLPASIERTNLLSVTHLVTNPILSAILAADGVTLTITFQRPITSVVDAASGFSYSGGTIASGVLDTGTIVLTVPLTYENIPVSIEYSGDTGSLYSSLGAVDSTGYFVIDNQSAVPAPPVLVSAIIPVDGDTLELTFTEDLTGTADLGFVTDVVNITGGSILNNVLTLTIDTVYQDDAVGVISYDSIVGDLTGLGGVVESFSDIAISNQSTRGPGVFAVWNVLDSNDGIDVSGGGLTASFNRVAGWAAIRANGSVAPTEKKYYNVITSHASGTIVGIGTAAASIAYNGFVGSDTEGFGWFIAAPSTIYTGGGGSAYGIAVTPGQTIGVAINKVDDELEFFIDGVGQGTIDISSLTADNIFPMISLEGTGRTLTANFGGSAWGTYPPPVGFTGVTENA